MERRGSNMPEQGRQKIQIMPWFVFSSLGSCWPSDWQGNLSQSEGRPSCCHQHRAYRVADFSGGERTALDVWGRPLPTHQKVWLRSLAHGLRCKQKVLL